MYISQPVKYFSANARKALKRKEAEQRQSKYDSLNVDQKLAQIKNRPGESLKEATKILLNVAKGKAISMPVSAPVTESNPKNKYRKIKKN